MQTTSDWRSFNRIAIALEKTLQLFHRRWVAAARETHVHGPANAQHIAAVERARRLNEVQCAMRRQRPRDRIRFWPARIRAGARDDGDFIKHQRGIFHKDGIG